MNVKALRIKNISASFIFISVSYLVYRFSPHMGANRAFTNERIGLSGSDFLTFVYTAYSLLLSAFYVLEKNPRESKSIAAMRGIHTFFGGGHQGGGFPRVERLGLLTILLKGFFAPIMLLSLFQFTSSMVENGVYISGQFTELGKDFLGLFNSHGFWFLLQLILFLDVVFYTAGYLVEHPALKNEIRSVDPSLLGWAVALACYPPFNMITNRFLGGSTTDFPQFENPLVHISINLLLLLLMAVFSWASISLNWKASNLTHRGIIHHGPYRYVRHPAYTAKNIAWWLGSLPAMVIAWEKSVWSVMLVISGVVAWTALYALRALTEETHLRQVDGEYDEYCRNVRYRFIPGVY